MIRIGHVADILVEKLFVRRSSGGDPGGERSPDRPFIPGLDGRDTLHHPGEPGRSQGRFRPAPRWAYRIHGPGPRATGPHPGHGHRGLRRQPGGVRDLRERARDPAPVRRPGRRIRPDEPPDPPPDLIARHGERSPPIPNSGVAAEDSHRAQIIDRPLLGALLGFQFPGQGLLHRPRCSLAIHQELRDVRIE